MALPAAGTQHAPTALPYRLDRAVRATLMLPAYLVSVIVGESAGMIDRSAWGLLLRVIAALADGLAIYFAGRAFGWW